METENTYSTDVVIIGAGPVGLFTVFECGMLKMKCHVIDSLEDIGGQCTALYPEKPIYDIPACPELTGGSLIMRLEQQASPFNPTYHLNQQVTDLKTRDDGKYDVVTSKGITITCTAVIVAGGAGAFGPNRPPLDNLEQFEGTSVFYMVKRRDDFAGKNIVIAGGGDSAVDWAVSLSSIAKQIYVVHRRDKFRAAPETVDKMRNTSNIELVTPYQLGVLQGDDGILTGVEVMDMDDNKKVLEADVLLPFFGITPGLGTMPEWGFDINQYHIPVHSGTLETSMKNVFAVGDIATYPHKLKLILTGFSEAAMAAHAIHPLVFPGEELHFVYSTTKGIS